MMKSVVTRFLVPFGILAAVGSVSVFYQTYESSRKHAYELISQQATMALEFNLAIRGYAGENIRARMEALVDKDAFIPETMSTSFISRRIFEAVKKKFPTYIIRFGSDNPRNPVNRATPDDLRMIEYFRQHPGVTRRTEEIQIEGRRYLAHFSPMILTTECLRCHTDPKDAPAELIKRYGPTAGFHRKLGDVVGLDTVAAPVEAINAFLAAEMRSRTIILAAVFILLFASIFYIFKFVVAKRLVAMASHFDRIAANAESSYMRPVEVKGNDEISVVGVAFNKLVEQLRTTHASLEQRVSERTEALRLANTQLQSELSERKRAEEALRKSEEKYRLLVDHAFDAVLAVDLLSMRIIEVNEAFTKLYGYSREEAIGMTATELSAEPEETARSLEEVIATGGSYVPQRWHRRKDGTLVQVEISAGLLKIEDREVVCAFTKDITERKRTEAKLAKINECFLSFGTDFKENIQRMVKIGGEILEGAFALYNRLDGNRLCCLGQWQAPPDYQTTDLAEGHICSEVIRQGADAPVVVRNLQASPYARSDPAVRQYNLQTYIGVAVYCQKVTVGSMCVVYQADIHPTPETLNLLRIIGSAIGVEEERRRAEEALRESEGKYRGLIETTNTGYVIVDPEGRVLDANPEYVRLSGHGELRETLGRSVLDWTAEQDRDKNAAAIKECIQAGLIKNLELAYTGKEGRPIPVEISATAISTSAGVKFLSLVRDISDRKQAEEEKARLEAQLRQAQKMEAIGTLAGGIAHDYNNILTAIMGNISLARLDMRMQDQSRERLTEAEKACLQAQNLSRQLLTFSKGGAPIKELVSVKKLVSESASFACRGSRIHYELSLPDNLRTVEADPGQISQVFQNLLINAIQAMPTGGNIRIWGENPDVKVVSDLPLESGRYVMIAIKDEGIGIAPEHLPRIFDPYFTTKQKGSGLGLATSYSIIKHHHGHIAVDSKLGKGTTFRIFLPASEQQMVEPPQEDRELVPGKGKILVMDDEEIVRQVLGKMLEKLGYEAVVAKDGGEAIELCSRAQQSGEPFTGFILDLTIRGGMGGREAIARLREIDPQVKAIVSSGYSDDPIMADFHKYGFAGVIAKPYRIPELGKALKKALDGED